MKIKFDYIIEIIEFHKILKFNNNLSKQYCIIY